MTQQSPLVRFSYYLRDRRRKLFRFIKPRQHEFSATREGIVRVYLGLEDLLDQPLVRRRHMPFGFRGKDAAIPRIAQVWPFSSKTWSD